MPVDVCDQMIPKQVDIVLCLGFDLQKKLPVRYVILDLFLLLVTNLCPSLHPLTHVLKHFEKILVGKSVEHRIDANVAYPKKMAEKVGDH